MEAFRFNITKMGTIAQQTRTSDQNLSQLFYVAYADLNQALVQWKQNPSAENIDTFNKQITEALDKLQAKQILIPEEHKNLEEDIRNSAKNMVSNLRQELSAGHGLQ